MIRFSVGYQLRRDSGWIDAIINQRQHVYDVFFSIPEIPNGRTGIPLPDGHFTQDEYRQKLFFDLERISKAGIGLNVLFNASCYGKDGQSSRFFDKIESLIDLYCSHFRIESVTTTSPFIAEVVKRNFRTLLTRASINMGIPSPLGMDYISDFFDGYYLKQEYNRNINMIKEFFRWCNHNNKQLFMIANSGCLNDCSIHFFHNNLAAHSDELVHVDKRYPIRGCKDYLSRPEKLSTLIQISNWIRPEDIEMYGDYFTAVKLATRIIREPEKVLDAYIKRHYNGSVLDLMEPDHSAVMQHKKLMNQFFPSDFGTTTAFCQKNCEDCTYCRDVFHKCLAE